MHAHIVSRVRDTIMHESDDWAVHAAARLLTRACSMIRDATEPIDPHQHHAVHAVREALSMHRSAY